MALDELDELPEIEDVEQQSTKKSKNVNKSGGDFITMLTDLLHEIPVKKSVLLILVLIIVFSDIFIDGVLSKFSDTGYETGSPNGWGTGIQIMFVTLAYICIDILVNAEIL